MREVRGRETSEFIRTVDCDAYRHALLSSQS
jgi:hypothetical protein